MHNENERECLYDDNLLLFNDHPSRLHHLAISDEAVEVHAIGEGGGIECHGLLATGCNINLLELLASEVIDIDEGCLYILGDADLDSC